MYHNIDQNGTLHVSIPASGTKASQDWEAFLFSMILPA